MELTPEDMRQMCRDSLGTFATVCDPRYNLAQHIEIMTEALEKIESLEWDRLMINCPPRHSKPVEENQLVLMGDGSRKRLKDIRPGDQVISHKGRACNVSAVYIQGKLPTLKITTVSGRTAIAAFDHPFFGANGWVLAKDLNVADTLAYIDKPNTRMQWAYIDSISLAGELDCRCLEVDIDHSFTAGDLIVHNSETASINFPAWFMGRHPEAKIAMVTYSDVLSKKNGGRVRERMDSPLFQEIFPDCRLSKTTRAKDYFQTTAGGECLFTTVGGQLTGFGADCIFEHELIITEIGNISIKSLCAMNQPPRVLSYDHQQNKTKWSRINASRKIDNREIIEIFTNSGHSLKCTPDHRIYSGGEYKPAAILRNGDDLIISTGKDIVSSIKRISGNSHTVYDLEIEGTNNFFAGGVLCHNCLLIDDPLKGAEEAKSKTIRDKLTEFYRADAYTRLMPNGRVILISTRWHSGDLAGWLLDPEEQEEIDDWNVLSFPAIAEKDEGWRQEGEALWPEMWPLEKLLRKKKQHGPWDWAALYQCRPDSIEGREVKREWWRYYDWDPYMIVNKRALGAWMTQPYFIFQSWDTASKTDQQHDYSVCTTWLVTPSGYYLLDVWRRKVISAELFEVAKQMAGKWGAQFVLVEHASHAISFIQALQSQTGLPIIPIVPRGDKEARMRGVAPLIFAGRVFLPRHAHWLADYMNELSSFPTAAHDDQVDSTSQLLHYCSMEDWRQKLMEQEEGDYMPPPDPFDV